MVCGDLEGKKAALTLAADKTGTAVWYQMRQTHMFPSCHLDLGRISAKQSCDVSHRPV